MMLTQDPPQQPQDEAGSMAGPTTSFVDPNHHADAPTAALAWCLEVRPDMQKASLHVQLPSESRFQDARIRVRGPGQQLYNHNQQGDVPATSPGSSTDEDVGESHRFGIHHLRRGRDPSTYHDKNTYLDLVVILKKKRPPVAAGTLSQFIHPVDDRTDFELEVEKTVSILLHGEENCTENVRVVEPATTLLPASSPDSSFFDLFSKYQNLQLISVDARSALRKTDKFLTLQFSFGRDAVFYEDEDFILCSPATDEKIGNLRCRECMAMLLPGKTSDREIEGYGLPSALWTSFSDCVACEECIPFRTAKIPAQAGRVYWSKLSGLAHVDDLCLPDNLDVRTGKCNSCGTVVADPVDGNKGIQLLKHKIFLLPFECDEDKETVSSALLNDHDGPSQSSSSHSMLSSRNLFAANTDEACVGLVLRDALEVDTNRRFRLVYVPPEQKVHDAAAPDFMMTSMVDESPASSLGSTSTTMDVTMLDGGASREEIVNYGNSIDSTDTEAAAVRGDDFEDHKVTTSTRPILVNVIAKRVKVLVPCPASEKEESASTTNSQELQRAEELRRQRNDIRDHMQVWYREEDEQEVVGKGQYADARIISSQGVEAPQHLQSSPPLASRTITIRDLAVFRKVREYLNSSAKWMPQDEAEKWTSGYLPLPPPE
ncbi:unnamed protein product [Amoebophrya sp. A120]|nr:unnamed protein product [Amoebophrya sp. A120]|eukprot:GSA120T00008247001.1